MEKEHFRITHDSPQVIALKRKDKRLATLIDAIGEIDCSIHTDSFAFIVEEIVGQMLSNKVATILRDRLRMLCGGTISADRVATLSPSALRELGLSNAKASYIISFSQAVINGEIDLNALSEMNDEEAIKSLVRLRGIGNWTAKMYLLFVLNRPDILPYEDGAFIQSFTWLYNYKERPSKNEIIEKCKNWHPYSSTAARYFYRALDMGFTKYDINNFLNMERK